MAKELVISDSSLGRVAKKDLAIKPYNIQQRQSPTSVSKQRKENVAGCRRQSLRLVGQEVSFYTLETVVSYQNDKVYATSPGMIPKDARQDFNCQ